MKNILCVISILLALLTICVGETRVRLTAKTKASSRDTENLWQTDYGSYDKAIFQIREVCATVQCTMGEETATLRIQWIGRNNAYSSNASVLYMKDKPLALKPGVKLEENFHEAFAVRDTNYAALGERSLEGYSYSGWIVRVIGANGKVLAEQSSSQPLLKKFSVDAAAEE